MLHSLLQSPATSSFVGANILFCPLFPHTLNLCNETYYIPITCSVFVWTITSQAAGFDFDDGSNISMLTNILAVISYCFVCYSCSVRYVPFYHQFAIPVIRPWSEMICRFRNTDFERDNLSFWNIFYLIRNDML